MDYIHSVLRQNVTAAAATTFTDDLPVNPLSHILLTVLFANNGVNTKATLANLLAAISKVEVLYQGSAIISLNGADLYALTSVILGHEPWQENVINLDNAERHITFIVPFGRVLFNPKEALFPTSKGELQLQVTTAASFTNLDTVRLQIETVEIPDANPDKFLKATTISKTPVSGDNDVDLPIGNVLAAILLFGTTVPTGTATTTTIDTAKLLANNKEKYLSQSNWESLHGALANRLSPAGAWGEKFHMENINATYLQNVDTNAEEQDDSDLAQYALIDFAPNGFDEYLFDTAGLSRLHLRLNAGDTSAIRVVPLELVPVGGLASKRMFGAGAA